jgi:catechol 2,3-dioxygenase-like lactoylglutathione lyase family enzyme
MTVNIRHMGFVVDDLDESLRFYMDNLGFRIYKKAKESGSFINQILGYEKLDLITVKMTISNGQMIELIDFGKHKKLIRNHQLNQSGPTHIALTVNNLDQMYREMSNKGVSFIYHPLHSPDGSVKVAFCQAPEGTYIELVECLN